MRAGTFGWLGLLLLIAGIITTGYSKSNNFGSGVVIGVALIVGAIACFIRASSGDDD